MIISKIVGKFTAAGKEVKNENESIFPEVSVSIASVKIETITEKNNMLNVVARAEGAQYTHSGYIAKNEPLSEVIRKAKEEDSILCLRFEKKRKKNVDPTLPIDDISKTLEIAQKNIIKMLSGCYDFNTESWVLTNEAESDPNSDPESITKSIKNLKFNADSILNPVQNTQVSNSPTSFSQNKEKENKENALISMYIFVKEQEIKHGYTLESNMRKKMAINLLKLSDVLQMKTLGLENPSYSAYSHTRARFLVFKIAETFKPIDKVAVDKFSDWLKSSLELGLDLWSWGIENS